MNVCKLTGVSLFCLFLFGCGGIEKLAFTSTLPEKTLSISNSAGITLKFDQASYFAYLEKSSNDATVKLARETIDNAVDMNFDTLVKKAELVKSYSGNVIFFYIEDYDYFIMDELDAGKAILVSDSLNPEITYITREIDYAYKYNPLKKRKSFVTYFYDNKLIYIYAYKSIYEIAAGMRAR